MKGLCVGVCVVCGGLFGLAHGGGILSDRDGSIVNRLGGVVEQVGGLNLEQGNRLNDLVDNLSLVDEIGLKVPPLSGSGYGDDAAPNGSGQAFTQVNNVRDNPHGSSLYQNNNPLSVSNLSTNSMTGNSMYGTPPMPPSSTLYNGEYVETPTGDSAYMHELQKLLYQLEVASHSNNGQVTPTQEQLRRELLQEMSRLAQGTANPAPNRSSSFNHGSNMPSMPANANMGNLPYAGNIPNTYYNHMAQNGYNNMPPQHNKVSTEHNGMHNSNMNNPNMRSQNGQHRAGRQNVGHDHGIGNNIGSSVNNILANRNQLLGNNAVNSENTKRTRPTGTNNMIRSGNVLRSNKGLGIESVIFGGKESTSEAVEPESPIVSVGQPLGYMPDKKKGDTFLRTDLLDARGINDLGAQGVASALGFQLGNEADDATLYTALQGM